MAPEALSLNIDEIVVAVQNAMSKLKHRYPDIDNSHSNYERAHRYIEILVQQKLLDGRTETKKEREAKLDQIAKTGRAFLEALWVLRNTDDLLQIFNSPPTNALIPRLYSQFNTPSLQSMNLVQFEDVVARMTGAAAQLQAESLTRPQQTRSANNKVFEIARAAADDYRFLTGRNPSRVNEIGKRRTTLRGVYVDYLREIFAATGVNSAAEHYAKEAIRLWREDQKQWRNRFRSE